MSGLVESATAIMRMAERRLDVIAHNVSNISTSGYKRRIGFAGVMAARSETGMPEFAVHLDGDQGRLSETGNPFDLAISGAGYFRVRSGGSFLFSRQGQFRRDADGLLVTPQGYILQQAGGGDLVLDGATTTIGQDGTVLDGNRPIARIAIERPLDGASLAAVGESFFSIPSEATEDSFDAMVRQGMIEASNVSLGDEMTQSMVAIRQAESGARLIQLYDELMGRAVSAFGSMR